MATSKKITDEKPSKKSKEDAPEGLDLSTSLRRLEKLAGAGGYPNLTVSATKSGGTLLSASANGSTAAVTLKDGIDGMTEALNFNFASLIGLTQGRKINALKLKASTLSIDLGRFKSDIVGTEASTVPDPKVPEEPTCEFEINGEMRNLMADALTAVNLQKPLAALPDITVHLSFKKKNVSITSFDKSQMVPLPRAEALFRGQIGDAKVKVVDGYLYASAKPYRMSMTLPPPTEAAGVPIERVMERSTQLRSMELDMNVDISREDLAAFMENAKVFFKSTAMLHLQVGKDGKSSVTVTSEGNTAKGLIRSKSKKEFEGWIDLAYVTTLMSKCKGETLGLSLDSSIFIFRDGPTVYSAVLSEPPSTTKSKKSKKNDEDEEG
jgi:hypothetical protein